jgi:hypothetical protein
LDKNWYYKPGAWNALCHVCGFKYKSDELKLRWDGKYVCTQDYEPRHPQDLFRVVPKESSIPWSNPDGTSFDNYAAITSTDSPYTMASTLRTLSVDATSGNITITLPAATVFSGPDQFIDISRIDTSSNTVTIQRAGSDTIDEATSITLSGVNRVRLISNDVSRWTRR